MTDSCCQKRFSYQVDGVFEERQVKQFGGRVISVLLLVDGWLLGFLALLVEEAAHAVSE